MKPQTCYQCAERTALYLAMDGKRRLCRPCAAAETSKPDPKPEPSDG